MTLSNPENINESFDVILERFAPKLRSFFKMKIKKDYLSKDKGFARTENLGGFQVNISTEGNIFYIETHQRELGKWFTIDFSKEKDQLLINLFPEQQERSEGGRRRTLHLDSDDTPMEVLYEGGGVQEKNQMLHADQLSMMEIFFEKHVFPELEKIQDIPVSGVVGLTGEQVSQQLEVEGGTLGSLVFEDPEVPYSQR